MTEKKGEVYHWVNSAKGIGVILVVLGHLLYESNIPYVNQVIYSFHMPLFFILSGYIQKKEIKNDFLKKKAKRLLIPFLAFTIIGFPIWGFIIIRHGGNIIQVLLDSFYIKGEISNNPLWYLVAFFEVSTVIFLIKIPERSIKSQIVILIITTLAGLTTYNLRNQLKVFNVLGFNRAIVCLSFYILGIVIKKLDEHTNTSILILCICIVINFISGGLINSKVSVYGYILGSYYWFYISAISGSLAVMIICKRFLDKNGLLENVSKYSILLLGSQYFVIYPFKIMMRKILFTNTIYYDFFMILVLYMIVILIPIIYEALKSKINLIKIFNGEVD